MSRAGRSHWVLSFLVVCVLVGSPLRSGGDRESSVRLWTQDLLPPAN